MDPASSIHPKRRQRIFNQNTPYIDRAADTDERTVFYGTKPDGTPFAVKFILYSKCFRNVT
jgi:hypothetical protein